MEHTLGDERASPADAGHPVPTGSEWDLADAAFVDEFDERPGRVRVTYDSAWTSPSFAVVTLVSFVTGVDPLDLAPLHESIDCDAVDALFSGADPGGSRLTFRYSGYDITVGTDAIVEVAAGRASGERAV